MRIAITHPTTFARVRRGTERFADDLASYLASKGHEVSLLACKPGRPEVVRERGYATIYHRRLWHPFLAKAGILEHHSFLVTTFWTLLRTRFDIVHSCSFTDGYAAGVARQITGVPNVLLVNGLPHTVRQIRSITLGGAVFKRAVQQASEVIVPSEYVHAYVKKRWERNCVVIPPAVDVSHFPLSRTRDLRRPIILCTSALNEPRKGGRLLMRAFDQLKGACPGVVLQICTEVSETVRTELLKLVSPKYHTDVQFLGPGRPEDLPAVYGRASASVLSSLDEPFGMVLLESMATGTPVVGTRHGGIPEVIRDGVGRLFDPGPADKGSPSNVDGLVQALREVLDLSRQEGTPDRCRGHVEQFTWPVIGRRHEELYERVRLQRERL